MSFDRPGLPQPGQKADEVEINEDLRAEGLELNPDGQLDGLDHTGAVSAGPQPNPPRRPHHAEAEAGEVEPLEAEPAGVEPLGAEQGGGVEAVEVAEPVDDPAHEDPARG